MNTRGAIEQDRVMSFGDLHFSDRSMTACCENVTPVTTPRRRSAGSPKRGFLEPHASGGAVRELCTSSSVYWPVHPRASEVSL